MLKFTKYGRNGPSGSLAINSLANLSGNGMPVGCSTSVNGQPGTTTMKSSLDTCSNYGPIPTARIIVSETVSHMNYLEKSKRTAEGSKKVLTDSWNQRRKLEGSLSSASLTRYQQNPHGHGQNEVHLKMTKVAPEELLRMDSLCSEIKLNKAESGKKFIHFCNSTIDLLHPKKRVSLKQSASVTCKGMYDAMDKVKVPIYDDGYFPKVQPLNKIFAKKRTR